MGLAAGVGGGLAGGVAAASTGSSSEEELFVDQIGDPELYQVCREEGRARVMARLERAVTGGGLERVEAEAMRELWEANCQRLGREMKRGASEVTVEGKGDSEVGAETPMAVRVQAMVESRRREVGELGRRARPVYQWVGVTRRTVEKIWVEPAQRFLGVEIPLRRVLRMLYETYEYWGSEVRAAGMEIPADGWWVQSRRGGVSGVK